MDAVVKPPAATGRQYQRYKAVRKFEGSNRRQALQKYLDHYAGIAATSPGLMNQKLPRKVFEKVLDEIGALLQQRARELAASDPDMIKFLERNTLPPCLGAELTPEVRAFSLLLNSLKQWTVAEQSAMDRFLISGGVREELRDLAQSCPIAPESFVKGQVELHHPVRDGRPPIPLSKKGHETVEGIVAIDPNDRVAKQLIAHRKETSRTYSWRSLRLGCLMELGQSSYDKTVSRHKTARSNVAWVKKETSLSAETILETLERYELGEPEGEATSSAD